MRSLFTKKRSLVALVAVAALAIAGGAFAYFSSSGSGSGSASVGKSSKFIVAEPATGAVTGASTLYPDASIGQTGGNVQTHNFSVTNPSAGDQNLAHFTVSIANSDGSTWQVKDSGGNVICSASDFSVGGKAVGASDEISSLEGDYKAGDVRTGSVTVEMIDSGANQDGCQNATVPLYYSAS